MTKYVTMSSCLTTTLSFEELEILRNELHFEELQAEARRLDEMRRSEAGRRLLWTPQGLPARAALVGLHRQVQ